MKTGKLRLLAVATMVVLIVILAAGAASAHTAYRYMSDGTGGEALGTHDSSYALSWIQGKAKGNYSDDSGYRYWIVLRDQQIYHHDTSTNRPGPYWNVSDPYYYTKSVQYTLNFMGYPLTDDNIFGPATSNAVKQFQSNNGLTADGVVGTNTYYRLSWDSH